MIEQKRCTLIFSCHFFKQNVVREQQLFKASKIHLYTMVTSLKSMGRDIFRICAIALGLYSTIIMIATIAVYYGNLYDRMTSGLFVNTSAVFQSLPFSLGWTLAMLLAGVVLIGPIDYYTNINRVQDIDLLLTILLIYFLAAIFVGINTVRWARSDRKEIIFEHGHDYPMPSAYQYLLRGFLIGFFTIFIFNMIIYLLIHGLTSLLETQPLIQNFADLIASVASGIISGFYGESAETILIKSCFMNGALFGVYGAFWTAVLLPPRPASDNDITLGIPASCDYTGTCRLPEKFNNVEIKIDSEQFNDVLFKNHSRRPRKW